MKHYQKKILVYADWVNNEPPKLIGTLFANPIRGKEVFSFEYCAKWLSYNFSAILDPSLNLFSGPQYLTDNKNNLWIAKFPSKNDNNNVGAWEMVVNKLAQKANINVAGSKLIKLSDKHHTFLSKRFDRDEKGNRRHFSSAMTMLGYQDGANEQIGVSYLEIVEFLMEHGGNVDNDLEELWRRIVFYICVSNSDDHLKNHGFVLTKKGWILSPAYDINPVEYATGLSLNISENDNSLNLDLAKEVAPYFRLSAKKTNEIINDILGVVKNWRKIADKYDIPKLEQNRMENAFK